MKTPMHNYFKGTTNINMVYNPYSIFSRKGYEVLPENQMRIQYLFNTYHTIGHALLIAIFLAAMLVFVYFKLADPKSVFAIFAISLPSLIMILNWGIARTLARDLKITDSRIGFIQRVQEIFTQSRESKLILTGGVLAILALFIFIPSRSGIETRIWLAAMCFYDFLISWII